MIVKISDDFDLNKIANCGQCFRAVQISDHTYRFIHRKNILTIREIEPAKYEVSCSQDEWSRIWHGYFDLDRNYSKIRSMIPENDNFMLHAADEGAGIRILRQDPWEMLITFILSIQKTIPAIRHYVELLSERYGSPIQTNSGILYAFPTPEQLSEVNEAELRACKVGYRAPNIVDAAAKVVNHTIDLQALYSCSYSDILETLMQIRGVGPKVANCIALFAYAQTAAAPVDTWIKKIIDQKYDGQNPFPAYGENAGIMQQYAFLYSLNHKKELPGRKQSDQQ